MVRGRLLERLGEGAGVRLVLVAAPAGYGKSTLLGTWREAEAASRPTAWLTLDEGDDDPVVLWLHAIEALRRVCPRVGQSVSLELVAGAPIVNVVLPRLINELEEQGEIVLVLDDFHRLSSGAARESLAWFVDHAPSEFQLVVSTRSDPPLPLASLRAHGELLELRAAELGFTSEEADALLNGRLELGLMHDDVIDLVERTEGWPAGLYLAGLSLRGAEDRHAFVREFGGTSRHVVDFLVDEVLEAEEPAMQKLMLRCSILERLSGPLCDALVEQQGSGQSLDGLSRRNLFVVSLDDRGQWYRFHHLFGQLLRAELEAREPGTAPTLHRRAYLWHRDHGSRDEAIDHALDAGAFAEAGELIAAAWPDYANAGRYATVLAWLQRVPDEVLQDDVQLLLTQAWVLSLCAEREEAARAIASVERFARLDQYASLDGFRSLEASLATLKASLPWGDVGAGLRNARRAAALEGPESPFRAVVCWALGMGLWFSGDVDAADLQFQESAQRGPLDEQWLVAISSVAYRSLIAGERGLLEEQRLLAERAVRLARERGIEEVDGEVFVAMGVSLARRGMLDEALSHLERGVAVLRRFGQPIEFTAALIRLGWLLRARGERERAEAILAEARSAIDSCADPGVLVDRLAAVERSPKSRAQREDRELTERELSVLRMLSGPLSESDIGRELYLSHNTIHTHTRSIYRKLGASSRFEALAQARRRGIL